MKTIQTIKNLERIIEVLNYYKADDLESDKLGKAVLIGICYAATEAISLEAVALVYFLKDYLSPEIQEEIKLGNYLHWWYSLPKEHYRIQQAQSDKGYKVGKDFIIEWYDIRVAFITEVIEKIQKDLS